MNNKLILFSDDYFRKNSEVIAEKYNLEMGKVTRGAYSCGEIFVKLDRDVTGKECLIIGEVLPPDDNFLSLILLADTLKRNGAGKIILFSPYLAYGRQLEPGKRESSASELLLKCLSASGIDKVVTVDLHNESLIKRFPKILSSTSPTNLFFSEIRSLKLNNPTIVAPDSGANKRAKEFAREAKISRGTVFLKKKRVQGGIKVIDIIGKLSEQAIIVDDILDTGNTLIACCEKLVENGVREIFIVVTHGFFSGSGWERLWGLNVKKIFTTNSIPLPTKSENINIKVLTVAPLIEKLVESYLTDE